MTLPVLSDSLQNYIVEINRFNLLSKAEERTLALRWQETGDVSAAHSLVTSNLRFVVKIAHEYKSYGSSLKDLIQEGNIGLMYAVKKFDPAKGVRLLTYAMWWIRSHMQEFIMRSKGAVKRGARALKKHLFYRNQLTAGDSTGASDNGNSAQNVVTEDLSLDAPVGEGATHMDRLFDPSPTQEELVGKAEETSLARVSVQKALKKLSDRERFIMEERVMKDKPLTLEEVGTQLGVTRERARQIEGAALKKLKASFS